MLISSPLWDLCNQKCPVCVCAQPNVFAYCSSACSSSSSILCRLMRLCATYVHIAMKISMFMDSYNVYAICCGMSYVLLVRVLCQPVKSPLIENLVNIVDIN